MPRLLSPAAGGEEDQPFPWRYPPFFFFFPQVATYGVHETRQVTPSPFWPPNAGLLQRLLFDSFLITLATDALSSDQSF